MKIFIISLIMLLISILMILIGAHRIGKKDKITYSHTRYNDYESTAFEIAIVIIFGIIGSVGLIIFVISLFAMEG